MATITIENAEVVRIIPKYGFTVVEKVQLRNGDDIDKYYTVWTKETAEVGERVTVEGELGVKLDEYTDRNNETKQKIAVNVNNALIMKETTAPF